MAKAIEPVPGIRLSGMIPQQQTLPQPLPIREGRNVLANLQDKLAKQKDDSSPMNGVASPLPHREGQGGGSIKEAIIAGDSAAAIAATQEAIATGEEPQTLINEQMIGAMSEVGHRFQEGKAFVPQLLMAGRAMKAALGELQPLMAGTARTSLGKVVIGTVKGDLHDIGKNLVASMLEGCGFEVVNIGIDVSADKFIEAVRENQPDILCMSALLTTTMGYMKEVIEALERAGIRNKVKVMVGGAPVTQGFADEIGADGYSDNANSAVTVAKQLLGKTNTL
ncbi:MAG: corrinoid protein [Prevotella sp.]|nr:corrinoid protein [Prevotella sp.]